MDGQQQENQIGRTRPTHRARSNYTILTLRLTSLYPGSCDAAIRAGNLDAPDSKRWPSIVRLRCPKPQKALPGAATASVTADRIDQTDDAVEDVAMNPRDRRATARTHLSQGSTRDKRKSEGQTLVRRRSSVRQQAITLMVFANLNCRQLGWSPKE